MKEWSVAVKNCCPQYLNIPFTDFYEYAYLHMQKLYLKYVDMDMDMESYLMWVSL